MFFPKAMTELELIIPSKDLVPVMKLLGNRGTFHQIDSTYLGLESLGPNTWQEKAANYSTMERRIQVIMQTLGLEEEYSGTSELDSVVDLDVVQSAVDRIEADVKATSDELTMEKKKLEQFENQLSQLEPIADLQVEIGALRKSKHLYSVPGIMPAENVDRLQTSLSRIPYVFMTLKDDPKRPIVWLLGPRSNSDIINRAVRSAYLNPLTLPEEYEGTPAVIVKTINREIETANRKISELESVLARLASNHKKELYELWHDVHISRVMADAIARFGQLRHTYVVVGWVPVTDLESLTQRLKQTSKEILVEVVSVERSGHHTNVPVALNNPGFLGAFELLVNTYARPRYEEIDPTILISVTFPLLYGAMYGDVGHGLVLAFFGWLLASKIVPALRGMASLGGLLIACGLSGSIFGFLFGSIFGFEEVLPHHPFFGQFVVIQPMHGIIQVLGIAIAVGIVLLNAGILLNIFTAVRAKNWGKFLFDSNGLFGWILYLAFLILVGQIFGNMLAKVSLFPDFLLSIAGLVFVIGILAATVFSHPLQHWMADGHFVVEGGWGMFIIQSLAEVLEKIISMFSNTMSYVRVGAFAIVHAGFTGAVFVIARLFSGGSEEGMAFWATVVLGNLFVIGLEGFIVAIQTMRLHYYEFFSKFFNGGGVSYEPLVLATTQENQ